ncbi:MAG: peptidoglycan DD-metalloendopeptidase family protein [Bacteroidota bacterium]
MFTFVRMISSKLTCRLKSYTGWIRLSFFFTAVVLTLCSCNRNDTGSSNIQEADSSAEVYVKMMYDLAIDSFYIDHGIVEAGQNLSEILLPYGISYNEIEKIVSLSDSVFDLRKIRAGNSYAAFYPVDSSGSIKYFVYEHNSIDYLVFDFTDSVNVYTKVKKLEAIRKQASGEIESSLWNAMAGNDLDPMLSIELSEIYAWSIDFFGLQKGDKFKVIYDEQYVDSDYVGLGKIYAACFYHLDSEFYAIPFFQDSTESFFDVNGNSLRKAFLKAPLRFSRISSRFSGNRFHPVLKIYRPHHGVDYAAPAGTPVHAIGDGVVSQMGYNGGAGNMVSIKHNSVYSTSYLHLSGYGNIHTGEFVKQGDVIGYVGNSGLSTGPHLDFRFYKNGQAINPLQVESPPVDPVKPENIYAFEKIKNATLFELDKITY